MKYHETSGQYTICSIGGDFDSPDAVFEAYYGKEELEINLPNAEAAREVCRKHAMARKAA